MSSFERFGDQEKLKDRITSFADRYDESKLNKSPTDVNISANESSSHDRLPNQMDSSSRVLPAADDEPKPGDTTQEHNERSLNQVMRQDQNLRNRARGSLIGALAGALLKGEDLISFEKKLSDKSRLHLHENFITMTVLCFLKRNVEEQRIVHSKRGSVLWSCLMLLLTEFTMIYCVSFAIYRNENAEFNRSQAHSFQLYLIKVPCVIALHFLLSPEVENGMRIMKYANQQAHMFIEGGSELAFFLGFLQGLMAIAVQVICLRMLAFQHSIAHSIIHFVALEAILELPMLYFESLIDNKLKVIMHDLPVVEKRGRDIKMSDRSCYHKVARVIYRMYRAVYVSAIYYFIPYAVIFYQWTYEGGDPAVAHH